MQCVRRGQRHPLQKGAELFLLIEPDQLVLFNLAQFSERLMWHNAAVTRLRLIDEGEHDYSEHVITDDRGFVRCIQRRYRPHIKGSSRVMLTRSARLARLWMHAPNRRDGWDRVRRSVPWTRVDHLKCVGTTFLEGDPVQESRMIDQLVVRWSRPDQVISGLEEIEPGVWHAAGESIAGGVVLVGPLWLGRGAVDGERPCLVGPAWLEDRTLPDSENRRVTSLKDIAEVELADIPVLEEAPAPGMTYQACKRAIDLVASFLALIVLLPVMAIISLCILIEDGRPIFFGHVRQGRGGRLFRCWKFRTMFRNADKIAKTLPKANDGPQVYIPDDPRVTRVGRILRRTNLDELPQFWNVLIGNMSLVGPRPSPDDENQYCPAWRDLRLSVRPGITGLWQLYRTREPGEDFQEWIKYDIQYVQRANFWLDLMILFKTAQMVLLRRPTRASK